MGSTVSEKMSETLASGEGLASVSSLQRNSVVLSSSLGAALYFWRQCPGTASWTSAWCPRLGPCRPSLLDRRQDSVSGACARQAFAFDVL